MMNPLREVESSPQSVTITDPVFVFAIDNIASTSPGNLAGAAIAV